MQTRELEAELERLHVDAFGWALACCRRDHSEAEEVMQTTYLKVLDGTARFGGLSSFKTWLYAVIRRTAAERRRRAFLSNLAVWRSSQEPEARISVSPEEKLQHSHNSARLAEELKHLPERQREVLHLVFYQDMSVSEAAETMGISRGSASRHYERGKRRLHGLLQPQLQPEECFP